MYFLCHKILYAICTLLYPCLCWYDAKTGYGECFVWATAMVIFGWFWSFFLQITTNPASPSDRKKTLPHLWGSHHQLDDKYSKPKKNSKIINIVGQLTSSLKDLSSKKKKSRNIFEKGRAGAEKYNVQRRAHPKSRCCENEEHCTLYVFGQVYRVWGSAVDVKRVTRVVPPHLPAAYFSNLYSPSSSSLPGNCFDLLTHISAHRKHWTWGGNNKKQQCNRRLNEI